MPQQPERLSNFHYSIFHNCLSTQFTECHLLTTVHVLALSQPVLSHMYHSFPLRVHHERQSLWGAVNKQQSGWFKVSPLLSYLTIVLFQFKLHSHAVIVFTKELKSNHRSTEIIITYWGYLRDHQILPLRILDESWGPEKRSWGRSCWCPTGGISLCSQLTVCPWDFRESLLGPRPLTFTESLRRLTL